jgi:hypothetical protein
MHATRTTALRERMRQEPQLAGLGERTQEAYLALRPVSSPPPSADPGTCDRASRRSRRLQQTAIVEAPGRQES